jgi:phosphoribosylglycinamide formyltransferase-1
MGTLIPVINSVSNIRISSVVTDRECTAIDVANTLGIPAITMLGDNEKMLSNIDPDLVVLAGYLSKFPHWNEYPTINTHPSLLPAFGGEGMYGDKVYEAVLESGVKYTGATVHYVDGGYDTGVIIDQRMCNVYPSDTVPVLRGRVRGIERELLADVLEKWPLWT